MFKFKQLGDVTLAFQNIALFPSVTLYSFQCNTGLLGVLQIYRSLSQNTCATVKIDESYIEFSLCSFHSKQRKTLLLLNFLLGHVAGIGLVTMYSAFATLISLTKFTQLNVKLNYKLKKFYWFDNNCHCDIKNCNDQITDGRLKVTAHFDIKYNLNLSLEIIEKPGIR